MNDTGSDDEMIDDEKITNLRAIFDPERKLETDEDLIELVQFVEDESDEGDTWVDHDLDFGPGN